jgi:D-alanine transfer protein
LNPACRNGWSFSGISIDFIRGFIRLARFRPGAYLACAYPSGIKFWVIPFLRKNQILLVAEMNERKKSTPHLTSAILAILLLGAALAKFQSYARSLEQRYANALAPLNLPLTYNGIAVQRAALHKPDLLPVYGSSELTLLDNSYEANNFFRTYPTGFAVFEVANLGASSLTLAQDLASLGPDLRGKKIVISISPADFTMGNSPAPFYKYNYSRLHAYAMIFSPQLSLDLKTAAARSMLLHPETLSNDPFMRFTLEQLAASRLGGVFYYLLWPLGELQTQIMSMQDHAAAVALIEEHDIQPHVPRIPQMINWAGIHAAALAKQEKHTSNNPFGVEDFKWWVYAHVLTHPIHPGSGDKKFVERVLTHPEWADFQILLRVLYELDARPLILSRPMNVRLWQALGVSEQAQNTYYEKLNSVTAPYHMQVVNLRQYGTDIYFSIDQGSHTSREGWVYIDQILDDFYHNRIP